MVNSIGRRIKSKLNTLNPKMMIARTVVKGTKLDRYLRAFVRSWATSLAALAWRLRVPRVENIKAKEAAKAYFPNPTSPKYRAQRITKSVEQIIENA